MRLWRGRSIAANEPGAASGRGTARRRAPQGLHPLLVARAQLARQLAGDPGQGDRPEVLRVRHREPYDRDALLAELLPRVIRAAAIAAFNPASSRSSRSLATATNWSSSSSAAVIGGPARTAAGALDMRTGALASHTLPAGEQASEPLFADGRLLALCHTADRAYVAVHDAGRIPDGPVARIWLDHHVPITFHGTFAPG